MPKEMFINAQPDECRIAIANNGALVELYTERASSASQVGNIYKGRVTNVEPSIQAAFVDFGKGKNGFLHISDLHPKYFPEGKKSVEAVGKKRSRRDRPPIQTCLRRGREVIVQVTKEGIGTKGATLTTYLSIPGRYLVLMPAMHRLGVSRKIDDETARARLRAVLEDLKPPPDIGFIVRTAGLDRAKRELQRDLNYLLRLWKAVKQRSNEARAPAELYQESDLVMRTIRDVYNTEIKRIVCDDESVACKVKEFLKLTMPRTPSRVDLYTGNVGLFHAFGLEPELEGIHSPRVPLPSGGSLVIDQAEALVAIDVNSGRLRDTDNAEQTAFQTNTEAAREATRQLRLRDLGGVIVIDFIDMAEERHRRQIENLLREQLKQDRARTKVLRMSRFGIIEMTRQRVRPSLASSTFQACPHCNGTGRIKSPESQALAAVRALRLATNDDRVARITLTVSPPVAEHILNHRRAEILALEQTCHTQIRIHGDKSMPPGEMSIACSDARGLAVQWDMAAAMDARPKDAPTREITAADVSAFRKRMRETDQPAPAEAEAEKPSEKKPKSRRRRGRSKYAASKAQPASEAAQQPAGQEPAADQAEKQVETEARPAKATRKRSGRSRGSRRRGRKRPAKAAGASEPPSEAGAPSKA